MKSRESLREQVAEKERLEGLLSNPQMYRSHNRSDLNVCKGRGIFGF